MAARSRLRLAHWVALVLILAPAWKLFEWAWGAHPRAVSARSAALGATLFRHDWTPNDPLASGDGLGPVFNARSCVECHNQGGIGGGGPLDKNVTAFGFPANHEPPQGIPSSGVVHQQAVRPELQETLAHLHSGLPSRPGFSLEEILNGAGTRVRGIQISQRNTPALFGDGLIDAVPDSAIIAHQREHSDAASLVGLNHAKDSLIRGRVARLADGRVGKFGWKGEFATLNDFVKAACANEVGLSNPGRPQPAPLGKRGYKCQGIDLTDAQCEMMTDFVRSLPHPVERTPNGRDGLASVSSGRSLFESIGCADCHTSKLGPVVGLFSDLLLHDMGVDLESAPGAYGEPPVASMAFAREERPNAAEWRTPPLWGVADSGPYLHDGRAKTLEEAIEQHGGEAKGVAKRFAALPPGEQATVVSFLNTLRAPAAAPVIASK